MNRHSGPAPLPRCLTVWLLATSALLAVGAAVRRGRPTLAPHPGAARFDDLLVGVCELVLLGCAGWLWAATTVVLVDAARGRVGRPRPGVPAGLRRLVLAACGLTLVGSLATPASATPSSLTPSSLATGDGNGSAALVRGLPLPDRASAAGHLGLLLARHLRAERRGPTVVVRPGDTLWGIARARLSAPSDPAEIDAAWRRLYRANRDVIGPDPDLIRPGQRLDLP